MQSYDLNEPHYIEDVEMEDGHKVTRHVKVCGCCGQPMSLTTWGYVKCRNNECAQCAILFKS